MDDDHLVMIEGPSVIKYSWRAPSLSGKRDVSLVDYISLESMNNIKQNVNINAMYKEGDIYSLFINDKLIEVEFDNENSKSKVKDISSEYFSNCASIKKNMEPVKSKNVTNLNGLAELLRYKRDEPAKRFMNTTDIPTTSQSENSNSTTANISLPIKLNYLAQLVGLVLVLVSLQNRI